MVGGKPKLNPLIRSAQPGPASALSFSPCQRLATGAGDPHLPLVLCWSELVEVKSRGYERVLVTCSSSMIY